MVRMVARGADGVVCIHTGAADVVDDPKADLSRVKFHSALDYPAVVDVRDGQTSVAYLGPLFYNTIVHRLFAHGRPGIPMVLGYLKNFGNGKVPLAGSVPTAMSNGYLARFVTLGADATHVLLHEYVITGKTQALPAQTLQWRIAVFDVDLTAASDPDPQSDIAVKLTADHVVLSRGKFDSDLRYVREDPAGMPMPKDRTLRQFANLDWGYAMDGLQFKSAGTVTEPPSTRVTW